MTGRKADEAYVPLPRNEKNRVDKKKIRELYLAADHVEWLPFCQAQGWNPQLARLYCPAQKWVEEKRQSVEDALSAELRALQLNHRRSWVKDVATTLEQYPKAVDNVMFLVQKWINREGARTLDPSAVPTKPSHLYAVAETVKKCIDAKKAILLISDAVVALAPPDPEAPRDVAGEWTMEIRGMKRPSVKEVQELFDRYVDKPVMPAGTVDTHDGTHEPTHDAEGADAEA